MVDRLLPFALSFSVTCTFFINACAWIFACGCRSLWAGGDALCNVHLAHSRHCPFCSHGTVGYAAIMLAVCLPQLAASTWAPWTRGVRIAVCLALFPLAMGATGFLLGWLHGYWGGPS